MRSSSLTIPLSAPAVTSSTKAARTSQLNVSVAGGKPVRVFAPTRINKVPAVSVKSQCIWVCSSQSLINCDTASSIARRTSSIWSIVRCVRAANAAAMVRAKATFAVMARKLKVTSPGWGSGPTLLGFTPVACQIHEVVAGDSLHRPIGHGFSAEAAVEAERGIIPVQHPPLQAPVAIFEAFFGEVSQQ